MKICSVDGCGRRLKARGLCNTHYEHRRLAGVRAARAAAREQKFRTLAGQPSCSEVGCGRETSARGLCGRHYQQRVKAGTLPPAGPKPPTVRVVCSVADCERFNYGNGLCVRHWAKQRRMDPATRPAILARGKRSYWRHRDQKMTAMRERYLRNPEKQRRRARDWRSKNPGKARAAWRASVVGMTPGYIRKTLRLLPGVTIPPALIEAKRAQLQILRLFRKKTT